MIPSISGTITYYRWLHSRRESFRYQFAEQAIKIGQNRERALEHSLHEANKTVSALEVKITAASDRIDTVTKEVNELSYRMDILNTQINWGGLPPTEKPRLESKLDYYKTMYERALQKQDSAIKELQTISRTNDPNIVKSSFFDLFYNLTDSYRDYLSVLTSEQLVILLNLIGYVSLTMIMTSITILLIGDHLIKNFNLETKYPKLADYIKYKQTINRIYLSFYIGFFILSQSS